MKQKLLIAAMGLMIAISGNAQDARSYFINASSMKEVFISDNVDVVLIPAAAGENLLKVDKSAASDFSVYTSGSELHIYGSRSGFWKKNTIYLTVGELKRLTLEGNVNLKTHGVVKTGKLDLYIGGDSKIQLRTNGKVKVFPFGDAEVKYEVRNYSNNALVTRRS